MVRDYGMRNHEYTPPSSRGDHCGTGGPSGSRALATDHCRSWRTNAVRAASSRLLLLYTVNIIAHEMELNVYFAAFDVLSYGDTACERLSPGTGIMLSIAY